MKGKNTSCGNAHWHKKPGYFFNFLTAILFLGCILSFQGCFYQKNVPRKSDYSYKGILITFTYQGRAKSVCLCGDFNNWSSNKDCLKRIGKAWKIRIYLPPGRYRYLFLVDGKRWICDPKAYLNEKDGYGRKNSVLIVEKP